MPRATDKPIIIDADSGIYACGFVCVRKKHFAYHKETGELLYKTDNKNKYNKWFKTRSTEEQMDIRYELEETTLSPAFARKCWDEWILNIFCASTATRKYVLLTKGGQCFRTHRAVLAKYKGNREGTPKPAYYDLLRAYARKQGAFMYLKWEADDMCRMLALSQSAKEGCSPIMAACDKDLEQITACMHYNPRKSDEGLYYNDPLEAARYFYLQMLMGDTVDNIKCLKGWGKVKAKKLLKNCVSPADMCDKVYKAYVDYYDDKPSFITPWWWDDKYNLTGEDAYEYDVSLVKWKRENFPERFVDYNASIAFFESADLLYMLKTPTDQYVPECGLPCGIPFHVDGVVGAYYSQEYSDYVAKS